MDQTVSKYTRLRRMLWVEKDVSRNDPGELKDYSAAPSMTTHEESEGKMDGKWLWLTNRSRSILHSFAFAPPPLSLSSISGSLGSTTYFWSKRRATTSLPPAFTIDRLTHPRCGVCENWFLSVCERKVARMLLVDRNSIGKRVNCNQFIDWHQRTSNFIVSLLGNCQLVNKWIKSSCDVPKQQKVGAAFLPEKPHFNPSPVIGKLDNQSIADDKKHECLSGYAHKDANPK